MTPQELWFNECQHMRFLFLKDIIFINDFCTLSEERKAVWLTWLKKTYPTRRAVFV